LREGERVCSDAEKEFPFASINNKGLNVYNIQPIVLSRSFFTARRINYY